MKNIFFKIIFFCLLVVVTIITVNSCKKRESPDTDTQGSLDNSICEGEFSRILMHTNSIAVGDSGVQKGIYFPVPNNSCPDIYIDSADIANGFPVTMWITYGQDTNYDGTTDIGCMGNDGKTRKGIIKAVFTDSWHNNGAQVIMDLDTLGYYVNDIKYGGTITVTKNSPTSFTQAVANGKCWSSGWTILWNSSRTMTINMGDLQNPNDDVSLISGSADGTDRNGKKFTVDISSPLRREMGCRWIVSGVQTLTPEGKKARTIDYGDGTCDNKAKLIIDGNTFEFSLQ